MSDAVESEPPAPPDPDKTQELLAQLGPELITKSLDNEQIAALERRLLENDNTE